MKPTRRFPTARAAVASPAALPVALASVLARVGVRARRRTPVRTVAASGLEVWDERK